MEKKKILVVDDEEMIRDMLEQMIGKVLGYGVILAESGEKALYIVDDCKPDLVLTDIDMPGMSGLELNEKIKARYPEIPVIFMTGGVSRLCGLHELGKLCLKKPFHIEDIERAIREALGDVEK